MTHTIKALAVATLALGLSGCAAHQQRSQMEAFNAAWVQGDYLGAAATMEATATLTGGDKAEDKQLLELLHQAEAHRLAGDTTTAISLYDRAETGMKLDDTTGLAAGLLEGGKSVLLNDAERDYTPMLAETVLVNTYKGLAFLQEGNGDHARIEFNRADDRTRRAVDTFAEEIAAQQEAMDEEADDQQQSIRQSLESDELHESIADNYGETSQWSVYPEFIVPSATYLHGLFFLASRDAGDLERAATSLKRVAEMSPGNRTLAADAKLATALAAGKETREALGNQVWVVYENGLGPVAEETRFDVPLLLFHGNATSPAYTGIALPRYANRSAVSEPLTLRDDNGETIVPEPFSEMGKVIHTEMQARFPAVLGRAVASAAIKALIQNAAAEEMGAVGQLGTALFAAATTQADLRSWQAIPDHWQVARVARPDSGRLTLEADGTALGELNLPDWPYTLVYVKRPSAHSPAQVSLIDLQGEHGGEQFSLHGTPSDNETDELVADAT
ncbi:COG3014 family protein [Billgrantia gudaonensis]|uniref:Tetratricopeptide repeat-containing protein n=1 Tax=Billgrantia gudaonensis TaxID=376427 RepID=A0A1G8T076_9GAMM|nr:hypothetical protein [Halomonas gudaonensis]SDJ34794.1 hypothetical protein SAMN04487954_104152 [Halomonas gudaonensis]